MTQTLTHRLAAFAAELTYERLPPDVVQLAKDLTLDTLGTALAATSLGAGCAEVLAVAAALGGPEQSTLLGRPERVSALNAAFANGALAHALNYDAIGVTTGHTGVVCFTTPFAMAEAHGPIGGRQFLTAAIVAGEVTARLTSAAVANGRRLSKRLLGGQYFGYFGAAAGAGRVLGLDAVQMHSAFGLALMQTAGSRQVVIGGDPPAKAIYGGFPNQGGVLAALLAHAGLDASIDAIEGEAGIFGVATDGKFDAGALVDDLGKRFAVSEVQFKPWPTSAHVVPFIEAALDLRLNHDARSADIESVELTGAPEMRDWFEPLLERRRPSNAASAANSTMFAVAHALSHAAVPLNAFSPAGLRDDAVLRLADRIGYRIEDGFTGGRVAILLRDGRRLEARVEKPLGHPSRPMSRTAMEAKFRDCCAHAPFLPAGAVESLIALIERLDSLDDVSSLCALLKVTQPG
jgi:2-methylcitrate dehydratase PrpD